MTRQDRIVAVTVVLLLQACASTPTPEPTPVPVPETMIEAGPLVVLPAEPTAFELGQRERALDLERQGQLTDAALAWEILMTIRPQQAPYRTRWLEVKAKAAAAAAERILRAEQAASRGQGELAISNYLAALAYQPDNAKAADALRNIERERVRKNQLGKLSRLTLTRRAMTEAEMVPIRPSESVGGRSAQQAATAPAAPTGSKATASSTHRGPAGERIEVEHASLLASQGEYDEAVAMLGSWLDNNPRDLAARSLLADVLYQQAESIVASNPESAVALLERSLQFDRNHPRAAQRLKQLKTTAGAPVRK